MALQPTTHITTTTEDGISTITLNRPDRLNAMSPDVVRELRSVLDQVDEDQDTAVAVLTGAGRGFCAGGDTKSMQERHTDAASAMPSHVYTNGRHLIHSFLSTETPLIAMVNGPAAGLGATIALFCDIIVMADEATIGDRHVNVGLVAGDGGSVIWPLLVGPHKAKEFLLTGRMLSGRDAADLGLVNRSVPLADLEKTTMELAREIAALPPYAVRATKASINRAVTLAAAHTLDASLAWERITMLSQDHREAVRARNEGRTGTHVGR